MNAPDVVLHVGMQQSGATMLQRATSRLRRQLRTRGVTFVGHGDLAALETSAGWVARASDGARAEAFAHDLTSVVDDERRKAGAVNGTGEPGIVLISSDHLLGEDNIGPQDAEMFRPRAASAVAQVIEAIDARRARLVLYVHRQDTLMEFCYLREVMAGRSHSLAAQYPYQFEPVLDYMALIDRLLSVSGVAEVVVSPFELVRAGPLAFVDDFLGAVGLSGQLDLTVLDSLSIRRVYSHQGLQIALGMNPHLETATERARVRDFVLANFAAPDDAACRFMPEQVRLRVLETYEDCNRQLFRTHLPQLPEDSYASDAATERLGTVLSPLRVSSLI